MGNLYELRRIFYIGMVMCFLSAGVCEFFEGHHRMGAVSVMLGIVQALIFLVRRE